jgi:ABC-type polysaccharide/polyol phosphate export permease
MSLLPKWSRSLAPLVVADLRRRYAGSVLGGLWAFLSPILEVAAYGIVFGWVLGAGREPGMPYAILIASGLFPWLWFRETIEGCSTGLSDNRWVRRSRVPSELLVARGVLVSSLRALIGVTVVFGYAGINGPITSFGAWTLPLVALVLQALASFGLGLAVAPLTTLFPDLRPTLVSALTLLTFASPVLYPETFVQGPLATALLWNPFTHALRLYRSPIEPLPWPSAFFSVGVGVAFVLFFLAAGAFVQSRLRFKARDVL